MLSAPSGAGKTTLANALRRRNRDVAFSVSATTRPPRPREVDGESYHFVSRDEFLRMRDAGELIEWAEVHGNLYGTPRENVRRAQARGEHLLLDIDVQGARQIRRSLPEAVLVFVLPPSAAALAGRLGSRGTEAPEVVRRRLRNAAEEVRAAPEFDFVVVNEVLATAVGELEDVLRGRAGGREDEHQHRLGHLLADLAGALHVDVQQQVLAPGLRAADVRQRGAVEVAVHLGPLDQLAGVAHAQELVARHEVVVLAVHLAGPRVARGRRDGEDDGVRVPLAEPAGQGGL
ncbi:MAG TPA: guanylate kinase, partial [Longimicrobium sp.]|nr:guanylate kinase [Longimicrobium sp.]